MLASADAQPRTSLGQHFLIDMNLMQLLVKEVNLDGNDTVLEVGTGTGSLTELLAEQAGSVISVEIDPRLAKIARSQLSRFSNVQVLCQDALFESRLDLGLAMKLTESLAKLGGRLSLVANLPYNLASPLLLECICGELPFEQMYFTVQKEVGERILSVPRKKTYGIMSIIFQGAGRVKRIRKLPPSVFWPEPEVDSMMMAWLRTTERNADAPHESGQVGSTVPLTTVELLNLREAAKVLLRHRRKKISTSIELKQDSPLTLNNLKRALEAADIDVNLRGEQLTVAQFIKLARALSPS